MFRPAPIDEQVEAAQEDRIRVLVIGAGIAGAGVAQLLRQQGLHPVLVERSATALEGGYMLGLMPLINEPVRSLGAWDEYCTHSAAMHRYQLRSSRDRRVRTYSLDSVLGDFGRYGGIERSEFMAAITHAGLPVTVNTTVSYLEHDADGVTASFRTENSFSKARFELVIAADGLHSRTRSMVLDEDEVESFDTGWGGWVAWSDLDSLESDTYTETWGRGFFIGRYPVSERIGVFIGGPHSETDAGPQAFIKRIRGRIRTIDAKTSESLQAIERTEDPYYWPFTDTRAQSWALGRVILLGDAAAGFLPTAGIGATMAMESAAVLASYLADATAAEIGSRLRQYEQVQRPRVIAAHENSRQLAKLMFRQGRFVCTARDIAMRFASVKMALAPIIKLHRNAPLSTR